MADLRSLLPAFEPMAAYFVYLVRRVGLNPIVTSARRSSSAQARLYRNYQRGLSRYPAAAPGTSAHEKGLAFDMVVTPESALPALGKVWQAMGGVWFASDPIHFQAPNDKDRWFDWPPAQFEREGL